MISLFKKLCLGAALPLLSGAALANHHEPIARYMVEAIPFALKEGKTLDDMMKLRGDFAKLAAAENFAYNAYVLTPHFMSRSMGNSTLCGSAFPQTPARWPQGLRAM